MNNAEMKIVYFDERDVIATSGKTIAIANSVNGVKNDNTYKFGRTLYHSNDITETLINTYFGDGAFRAGLYNGSGSSIRVLVNKDSGRDSYSSNEDLNSDGSTTEKYNATFLWNGSGWQKQ